MNVHEALNRRGTAENVLRHYGFRQRALTTHSVTVVVSADFSRYVAAMAEQWPEDADAVAFPTVEEARWPFPGQYAFFVWEEPLLMRMLITSEDDDQGHQRLLRKPFVDKRILDTTVVVPPALTPTTHGIDSRPSSLASLYHCMLRGRREQSAHGFVSHVHPDGSASDSFLPWGGSVVRHLAGLGVDHCTRFDRAFVEAIGSRLATITEPKDLPRYEHRAIERSMTPYRLLTLNTPNRPTTVSGDTVSVEWSHRWVVRGFWRNQPYGEGRAWRRIQWIDPFIKGPADKPLDIRPDIFKAKV